MLDNLTIFAIVNFSTDQIKQMMKKKITALCACFFVLIITARAQSPTVTFTATPSTPICAGTTVSFSNSSTGSPTSWTWYFPGAIPSDTVINGAPGNPASILYPTAGTYYVTCVVKNSSGTDSVTVQTLCYC